MSAGQRLANSLCVWLMEGRWGVVGVSRSRMLLSADLFTCRLCAMAGAGLAIAALVAVDPVTAQSASSASGSEPAYMADANPHLTEQAIGLPVQFERIQWPPIKYEFSFAPGWIEDPTRPPDRSNARAEAVTAVMRLQLTTDANGNVSGTAKISGIRPDRYDVSLAVTGQLGLRWCQLNAGKSFSFAGVCAPTKLIGQVKWNGKTSQIAGHGFNQQGVIAGWLAGRPQLGAVGFQVPNCRIPAPALGAGLAEAADRLAGAEYVLRKLVSERQHADRLRLLDLDRALNEADLRSDEAVTVWQAATGQSVYGRAIDDRYVWSHIDRAGALARITRLVPEVLSAAGDANHHQEVVAAVNDMAEAITAYDNAFADAIKALPQGAPAIPTLAGLEAFSEALQACAATVKTGVPLATPGQMAAAADSRAKDFAVAVAAIAAGARTATGLETELAALNTSKLFASAPGRDVSMASATRKVNDLRANEARLAAAREARERALAAAEAARQRATRLAQLAKGQLTDGDVLGAIISAQQDLYGSDATIDNEGNLVRRVFGVPVTTESFDVEGTRCTGRPPQVSCQFTLINRSKVWGVPMPIVRRQESQTFEIGPGTQVRSLSYKREVDARITASATGASTPTYTPPQRAFGTPFEQVMMNHACGRVC